jgi:nucleotide-binding universal stress UspA family protein
MAQRYDAEVTLGWVVQLRVPAVPEYEPAHYGLTTLLDTTTEKERAQAYLAEVQEAFRQAQIRTAVRIVESHSVADAIISMAFEDNVDLIVKTTYARLGLSRWLQGNVAARVLQRAPCPLFLVRVSDDDDVEDEDSEA